MAIRNVGKIVGIALMGALSLETGLAGETRGTLRVSATVVPRAVIVSSDQPQAIEVSDADIGRGQIDVAASIVTRTNDPAGIYLMFARSEDPFGAISVVEGGREVEVGREGSWLAQPFDGTAPRGTEMVFRIDLPPSTRPGSYVWPIHISVMTASR